MEPAGPSKQGDGASDDANRLDAPLSLSDIKQASLHLVLLYTLGGDTRQSQPGLIYNSKCRIQQSMQGEAVSLAATERDCPAGKNNWEAVNVQQSDSASFDLAS